MYPPGSPAHHAAFWAEIEAAFSASVDLPEDARRAFLQQQYGDRPDIRAEVESLVAAHMQLQRRARDGDHYQAGARA